MQFTVYEEHCIYKNLNQKCICFTTCRWRSINFGFHTGGHFGRDKIYNKIGSRFYWPEIAKVVRNFIAACDICQKINDGGK